MSTRDKFQNLQDYIRGLGSVLVAYSGGVDSTFLLKTAYDLLGEKVLAVTARSATYPQREYDEAVAFVTAHKIPHRTIISEELAVEGFSANPVNRCYLCKKELFGKLKAIAVKEGLQYVAEGSNLDDNADYRPGLQAVKEFGIVSPLRHAELTKAEIRVLSKEMGLPTWNKPSFACLSSRFPYGEIITAEKLAAVDRAEQCLIDAGFSQVRVRHHGRIARIEILPEEFDKLMEKDLRERVIREFKKLGFSYVALDLAGYRTGSMNEVL